MGGNLRLPTGRRMNARGSRVNVRPVQPIQSVRWAPEGRALRIIDQRRLPAEFIERDLASLEDVREAIATLAVRGAPAIGVAAAIGLVASLLAYEGERDVLVRARLRAHAAVLRAARPTAVNLPWAMARMLARADAARPRTRPSCSRSSAPRPPPSSRRTAPCARRSARTASQFVPDGARVLTHCNAGALATAGIGTALAPVYLAHRGGPARQRLRRRNPPAPAGQPPHGLGAVAGRHSRHDPHRPWPAA